MMTMVARKYPTMISHLCSFRPLKVPSANVVATPAKLALVDLKVVADPRVTDPAAAKDHNRAMLLMVVSDVVAVAAKVVDRQDEVEVPPVDVNLQEVLAG